MKKLRGEGRVGHPPSGDRDFAGEKRSNETHASTTEPEAKLYKKSKGKEAKLSYIGNVMTENRNGFVVEAELRQVSGTAEREVAKTMIVRYSPGAQRITVGGDKGCRALARLDGLARAFRTFRAATAACAVVIYFVVPEPVSITSSSKRSAPAGLKTVYRDPRFWRLAPLSATCVGSAWALQGLWAAPWLADVEGLDRPSLITRLFVMAVALSFGALLLGTIANQMRRRGVGLHGLLAAVAAQNA